MRKVVVEVQCSRCDRKETREHDAKRDADLAAPQHVRDADPHKNAFEALLWPEAGPSVAVRFEDLCAPCERSVRALVEQIGKKVKGMSPDRVVKEEKAET